jgi:hypothetical protein
MKRTMFIVSYLVLFVASIVIAQLSGGALWTRTYGDDDWDSGRCVQATSDGGYVIAGFTFTSGTGQDIYLIKTDDVGDTLWTKCIRGEGSDDAKSIQELPGGGYIVAGNTQVPGIFGCDIYLIKTDADGDTIWTRKYGDSEAMGTGTNNGNCVERTSDGGYIVAGYSQYQGPHNEDVWLIKTDADGDSLWSRFFGGAAFDMAYTVEQTSDDGYIAVGYTLSFGEGNEDVYLVKTDALGSLEWAKTYGGTGGDYGRCVRQTSDDGYIITGYTNSFGAGGFDVYLIRTDALGDTLWTRTYGGGNDDISYSLQITAAEGYIISGKTASFGAGGSDTYLIETAANGDTLWTRTYGGTGTDKGYFVQLTLDGNYIITGETSSYGGGDYDVLLMKVGDEVTGIGDDQPILTKPCILAQNYPNPFNPSTVISYDLLQASDVEIDIYSLSGRRVKTLVSAIQAAGAYKVIWDGRNDIGEEAASGVYVCRLDAGGYVQTRKMVLTR